MADTETKLEALEQEAVAETSTENTQVEEAAGADAPKKNAVAAEPISHCVKKRCRRFRSSCSQTD